MTREREIRGRRAGIGRVLVAAPSKAGVCNGGKEGTPLEKIEPPPLIPDPWVDVEGERGEAKEKALGPAGC